MSTESTVPAHAVGEYLVVQDRVGEGLDRYYSVTGPDGSTSEQQVIWTYAMTPYEAAEKAVAGHLGHEGWTVAAMTREGDIHGYVVTVG